MNIIYNQDATVSDWIAGQIPHVEKFPHGRTIGVTLRDHLIAGFIFTEWQEPYQTIQLSMAATSPIWAKKEIIAEVLHYPFEDLRCYKVFTSTPIENEKALRVNAHIGFKREAVLAHQFGQKRHAVIMRLLLPDYDRLWRNHGQKQFAAAAGHC